VKKLVLRLSFVAALLALSCFMCDLARAQNKRDFLSPATEPAVNVTHSLTITAAQFPATDELLTSQTPFDSTSFLSSSAAAPLNFAVPLSPGTRFADPIPSPAASPAFPAPEPKPKPRPYYGEDPHKWQLGLAFALVRFRSSIYFASAPGLNTSLAYWWKEWVAIEGSVTSAFAPPVFENEHFRYLGYGAGPKFSFGHDRLQPWAHALVGGVHLIPQTASSGRNGAEITMGGGIDYTFNDVLSAKGGVDYLGTHMFGEWQSSLQVVAGLSLRF
jgi:hypothetical protein